jgi:hypothetical protein
MERSQWIGFYSADRSLVGNEENQPMRRLLGPSILLVVAVSGCIDRGRVNARCAWTGDTTFPIDLLSAEHQQHLINDAQLAEEIAIRYADAEHERRFGSNGHGGLVDNGRFRNECMARLAAAIESNHGVTAEQVRVAREQRNPLFDLAAALSFLPLYCLGVAMVCRRLRRRFSSDQRYVSAAVTGLASIAASFLGLQWGQLWLVIWEMIRVGNSHLGGSRAAVFNHWSYRHVGALFVGGVVLFWLIDLSYGLISHDERPIAGDDHRGIVLT